MSYEYEQISYQIDLPIKIFTHAVERYPYHWHEDTEILFVLSGMLEIRINEDIFTLREGDLFLVNGHELHFVNAVTEADDTQVLVLQIDQQHLKSFDQDIGQKRFHLHAQDGNSVPEFVINEIKYILAQMMDILLNEKALYHLKIEKLLLQLVIILLEHCELPEEETNNHIHSNERIIEIITYMNQHFAKSHIGLQQIADEFSLHPQYLSRYFREKTGTTLKKFLDSIRLNKSLYTLQTTDDTITNIVLQFGFPDSKAYYRVFREVMETTPSKYRKKYKIDVSKSIPKNYLEINSRDALAKLFTYLKRESLTEIDTDEQTRQGKDITINTAKTYGQFNQNFTKLLTFGYAPHGLRRDFQEQLQLIQHEIGFSYVRFHGIFADELLVYNENSDGTYYFNFNHIDSFLDGLLDQHIKPFIELGFMPKKLAQTSMTIFNWQAHISPPKIMSRWLELLDAFFRHIINRYGIREILSWYFEFWNEPEIEGYFWGGTREEFFGFYEKSFTCIKTIHPDIQLGGFGNIDILQNNDWLIQFDQFAESKNITLDFYSFHIYNVTMDIGTVDLPQLEAISTNGNEFQEIADTTHMKFGSEAHFTASVDKAIAQIKELEVIKNKPLWITEWNANTDSRDLLHDTCYMATFIVKNMLENHAKVNGMGYWTFTDIFEEFTFEKPIFHGGFGLLTYNGLKKPAYHAFYFLKKLGDQLVYKKDNIIVTKDDEGYQMLLFNYSHPNKLYSSFDYSQLSLTNRYNVFENDGVTNYNIQLQNLLPGKYVAKKLSVNRQHGSSFDAWVDIGAPAMLDHDVVSYLKARAEPKVETREINIQEYDYAFQTTLQPHEIQFIQLKRKF